jgi:hypothetical protein
LVIKIRKEFLNMRLTPELAAKGFVSSLEEEEYEVTRALGSKEPEEPQSEDVTEHEMPHYYASGREIFEDDDNAFVRELF